MNRRFLLSSLAAVVSFATATSGHPGVPAARGVRGGVETPGALRTAWGDPDLQGVWNYSILTPLERPASLAGKDVLSQEEAAAATRQELARIDGDQRVGTGRGERSDAPDGRSDVGRAYNEFWRQRGIMLRRTSLIVDPSDGRLPPMTPEGQKRASRAAQRERGAAASWEDRNLAERCILWNAGPPMLPTTYNANFQLFQTRDHVAILNEMIHDIRIIPLDRRPHDNIRQWLGDSRGHWDGHTLVVDTTGFSSTTAFRGSTENLHVVERFTRVDANTLDYEFTVDDPGTWTQPWRGEFPATKTHERIYEYACHEGNYGMEGILAGARAEERATATRDR